MSMPVILLVDDVPELGIIVASLGKRGGYETACLSDVQTAWNYLETNEPDLILLDVHLAGGDGLQLCRLVRAAPRLAEWPVALFSHWSRPGDIADGLAAGIDYLVSKDLVSQPAQWRRRLGEILSPLHGQRLEHSLGWKAVEESSRTSPNWVRSLNRSFAQSCWRRIGDEVLRLVLQRALRQAFPGVHAETWIQADDVMLLAERAPASPSPDILIALVASLAEQIWCLLGTESSKPFWEALELVVPGSPQLTSLYTFRPSCLH